VSITPLAFPRRRSADAVLDLRAARAAIRAAEEFSFASGGSMRFRIVVVLGAAVFPVFVLTAQSTRTRHPAPTPETPRPKAAVAPARTSTESYTSIGLRVGTLGVGVDVSRLLNDHIGLRVGASYLTRRQRLRDEDYFGNVIGKLSYQEVNWDVRAKANAFSGFLDWYPGTRGVFRFSVGAMTSPLSAKGVGVITADSGYSFTTDVSRGFYRPASIVGTFVSSGKFPSVLPYVGLGFGTPSSKHHGVHFIFDLGAAIGKSTVTLTSTTAATTTNPTLRADLAAKQSEWQTDILDKIPFYPVLSLGVGYRF
jgi:hypothetical protein